MADSLVKARCNLFAVLRGIEYLLEKDDECTAMVKGTDFSIQFIVKNGPVGNLSIKSGKALMQEGRHKSSILLYFTSPEHFNKMIDGKANPIPLKGLTKLSLLTGPFTKLTDKLSYYLKPEENQLENSDYFKINTELTAYTAFFALAEIANYDQMGKMSGQSIPDGIIQIQVDGGIGVQIKVEKGKLACSKGHHKDPRAVLSFADLEAAHQLLNGMLDTFTGLGNGKIAMKGYIPMLDNMNPILDLIPQYLK